MSFDVIELEQGTPAWKKWRSCGIGASDAPAFMGENPWKSAAQVLQEKLAFDLSDKSNEAMRRGTALEPFARAAYCTRIAKSVAPACVQSQKHPWMRASLDGINFETMDLVEIKCGESVYNNTLKFRRPPSYYIGQLQFILAVTGFQRIDFWCYLPSRSPVLVEIARDDSYIDRLTETLLGFWRRLEPEVRKRAGEL